MNTSDDELQTDVLATLKRWKNRLQRQHALLSECCITRAGADITQQVLLECEGRLDELTNQIEAIENARWEYKPKPIRHEVVIEARIAGGDEDCNLSTFLNDKLLHDYGTFGSRLMAEHVGRQAIQEAVRTLSLHPTDLLERLNEV